MSTHPGNVWLHENTQVDVKPGDTVNYWILVVKNGEGKQLTDQSWTAACNYTYLFICA